MRTCPSSCTQLKALVAGEVTTMKMSAPATRYVTASLRTQEALASRDSRS
jgi:hypothetical protein